MTRNAIITGSAQGIGKGIAEHLILYEGYNVVINDLAAKQDLINQVVEELQRSIPPPPQLERDIAPKGKVIGVAADVSTEEGVATLIEACITHFGQLDVMVCNAGIAHLKPILETTIEEFDRVMAVNVRSVWIGYRLAAQQMIKQGTGGRIIAASSIAGKKGFPSLAAYSSSKFAIRGLTQSAAQEWGKYGITVNAYCPGLVSTPILDNGFGEGIATMFGQPGVPLEDVMKAGFPVGRLGKPEDVARVVAYLASDKSSFITGQSWIIDGSSIFD